MNVGLIGAGRIGRLHAEHLEVWYGQKKVDDIPRLRGEGQHRINYRHIIDSLVRKPGAFENYRYRDELFPTSCFRIAYDVLKLEREIMIQDVRGYGARVIDWKPDVPLLQILGEARNI